MDDQKYDEDLYRNPFYCRLQSDHKIILDTAPLENWIICIPRSGTINPYDLTENNYLLSHILIPNDELPETHYTNLMGTDFRLENEQLINNSNSRGYRSTILFEELFYTKGLSKYKVWCIDSSLYQNSEPVNDPHTAQITHRNSAMSGIFIVRNVPDAIDLIWLECQSKALFRKIESNCKMFTIKGRRDAGITRLKCSAEQLFQQCLKMILFNKRIKDRCRRDVHYFKVLKIALETYMMNFLYKWLFDAVTVSTLDECTIFNQMIRNLADIHVSVMNIEEHNLEICNYIRLELCKIERYQTAIEKLACLRRAFNATSRVNSKNLCIDELIPIVAFAVIKSGLTHWWSTIEFLKNFIFNDASDTSDKGADCFLVSTIEAAVTYIKTVETNRQDELLVALSKSVEWKTNFNSKDQMLEWIFNLIQSNNEEMLLNTYKGQHTFQCQADMCVDEAIESLCHPLCDCAKCNRLIGDTVPHVNAQNSVGLAPVHIATKYGVPKMLNILLALGCDIHLADEKQWTALHYSAAWGHQSTLLLLLHAGANINSENSDNNTPLHLACLNGHLGCAKALLYYADHMRVKIEKNRQNKMGDTALHLACKWGFLEIIDTLLESGVKTDLINRLGEKAQDLAHNSHILDQLHNVFVVIEQIDTSESPNHELFRGCIEFDLKDPTKKSKNDKILAAIRNNDMELAYHFLGIEKSDISEMDTDDCHPLCCCKNCSIFNSVTIGDLNKSINVNESNSAGFTPLHAASQNGNITLIIHLLKLGARTDLKTISQQTVLHLSIFSRNVSAVNLILNHISTETLNVIDSMGNTALILASESGQSKLVQCLLAHDPNIEIKNNSGQTALMIARNNLYFDIVSQLENVSTEIQDLNGIVNDNYVHF